VWVDPANDRELVVRLQAQLRSKVIARGVAIEVNPSSNLLIGDYGNLSSHPLWRLRPPKHDASASELSVCIGSDDPAVFASNIREEYQWVEDAMRLAGISDEEARRWLARTRECSLETRFTISGLIDAPGPPEPRGEMPAAPF
jgi:adenosine deaminase